MSSTIRPPVTRRSCQYSIAPAASLWARGNSARRSTRPITRSATWRQSASSRPELLERTEREPRYVFGETRDGTLVELRRRLLPLQHWPGVMIIEALTENAVGAKADIFQPRVAAQQLTHDASQPVLQRFENF